MRTVGQKIFGRFRLDSAPKRRAQRQLSTTGRPAKQPRKQHTKSRNGCSTCKRDRVKCDEARPFCGRCSKRRDICVYEERPSAEVRDDDGLQGIVLCDQSLDNRAELHRVQWRIESGLTYSLVNNLLNHGSPQPFPSKTDTPAAALTPNTHLAQHLARCIDTSFQSYPGCQLFHRFVLPNCAATPALMHSLLALSARQLQYFQPSCRPHERAYLFHTQVATKLLNEELSQATIAAQKLDFIFATCLVINMISFATNETITSNSWLFMSDSASIDNALNWFMVQQGMGCLFKFLNRNPNGSVWNTELDADTSCNPLFAISDDLLSYSDLDLIPQTLAEICCITADSTPDNNPYYMPLVLLSRAFRIKSLGFGNLNSYLSFGPYVPQSYRLVLRQKDERALLLFMLWLMLFQGETCWWISRRTRNEYAAVLWLLRRSEDGRIREVARDPTIFVRSNPSV
ncbi:C6 transcription factor [Aspergillus nomiae NRRL 13137]|uniref:C6 transcription factor n=1 Tax=Aspergillus nomiae NRRL (strain ATCC 15546 / NRRL 13137 / CBS 260.88 / M93) TaxID=1509407 RepID=A0A0L1JAX1_ASPN3|nr:C6 transcription factor [Aspergillus nomiae NRRL 13137]KNG88860.1 C6 transcription factor [Aspergillus nomiae NRRL 13137]